MLTKLKGKKTYVVAGLLVALTSLKFYFGEISIQEFIEGLVQAGALAALRSGMDAPKYVVKSAGETVIVHDPNVIPEPTVKEFIKEKGN